MDGGLAFQSVRPALVFRISRRCPFCLGPARPPSLLLTLPSLPLFTLTLSSRCHRPPPVAWLCWSSTAPPPLAAPLLLLSSPPPSSMPLHTPFCPSRPARALAWSNRFSNPLCPTRLLRHLPPDQLLYFLLNICADPTCILSCPQFF